MARYIIHNYAMVTTAQPSAVTTGTSVKTMLQLVPKANVALTIVEWGISFDGSAAATPGTVELIETDVGATITQSVANDIKTQGDDSVTDPTQAYVDVSSTSKTGYTASAEGTITATRPLAGTQLIAPTGQYVFQFPLGREGKIQAAKFGRIRVKFGTAVNAICYIIFEA